MGRPPPMTSFVGRDSTLRRVRDLLGVARLVTVTGTGGIGKTRLALEIAHRSARAFPDGVAVAELAALDDGDEVAPTVAEALAVPDQSTRSATEQVVRHLAGRRVLLVLDNCEHVLDAVADLLTALLEGADGVTVLATSREPVGLPGEHVVPLGPLTLPAADRRDDAASVEKSEAVRLLVERARSTSPHFAVTDANREAVVQLCERLDGMPLAIELASVRLRSLSVEQVLDRLGERFSLLTGGTRADLPRHRTLWNLVDWSHELCGPDESLVWGRMSVFSGAFDLEAAEEVCADEQVPTDAVLDVVDRLVAKSIVIAEPDGRAMRYRMLGTIREYGVRLLTERGEWTVTKRRHRDHFLERAAVMVTEWNGPLQPERLAAMRRDHANLVAALEWSVTEVGEAQQAAQLASLLRYHWIGGYLSDGRRWLERILALDLRPTLARGSALWVAAWVSLIQGDRPAAAQHLAACHEVADELDDPLLGAHADHWTGLLQLFSGDPHAAIESFRAAAQVFERAGDVASLETVLFQLAMAQTYDGAHEDGLTTARRVLELSGECGEMWSRAYAFWIMGVCQWHLRDVEASLAAATSTLQIQRGFLDGICVALTTELLAWLAADVGQGRRAAELSGAAATVWRHLGTGIEAFGPHTAADSTVADEQINSLLGVKEADAVRSAQHGLSRVEVVELALGLRRASRGAAPDIAPLTAREFEVAQLIADGMSNRAIAERLVISTRTVDGHVERMLAKLDYTSRTQIASWAAERDRRIGERRSP
jgi:predicted ATPase/DNA-binding CsgD family transcriptional regulator